MNKINDHVSLESILTREINYWQNTRSTLQPAKALPVNITLSFDHGTKINELADRIGKSLNWKVYDRELVDYIASNSNVRKEIIKSFDEQDRSQIELIISTIFNNQTLSSETYFRFLVDTITSISQHGSAIFLGRGSHVIVPSSRALKIRLVENPEDRIKNLMGVNINKDDAAKDIKAGANKKSAFLERFFLQKKEDMSFYDLIINMSTLSMETAESIILTALQKKFNLSMEQLFFSEKRAS
ncbi:MAG: cytidylate kinase-like family protein [Calditrichae bacterium]|nr:cytidylate kinase-like family protein [Calditrichota bacterium]MCB9059821.1 cytidylate kinase-like family protein [Calditrichia bacterium]